MCTVEFQYLIYHCLKYRGYVSVINNFKSPFPFVFYSQYLEIMSILKVSFARSSLSNWGFAVAYVADK